jgi:hypothetical protein
MSEEALGMSYYPVLLQPHRLTEPDDIGYYSVNRPSLLAPVPQNLPQILEPTEFLPTSISDSSKTTSLVKVYLGSDFFQGVVRIVRK